jgi:hypothetical protein
VAIWANPDPAAPITTDVVCRLGGAAPAPPRAGNTSSSVVFAAWLCASSVRQPNAWTMIRYSQTERH